MICEKKGTLFHSQEALYMRHKEYTIQTYTDISKILYGHAKKENLGMDNVYVTQEDKLNN